VLRCVDGGKSWTIVNDGLPWDSQVFALARVGETVFAGLYGQGLYRLAPGSAAWRKVAPVSPLALASTGQTLVAGHNPGGIFWTEDVGQIWQPAHGLPSFAPVWAMASNQDQVFAGVADGIYYSEDGGREWARAIHGLPERSAGIAFAVG